MSLRVEVPARRIRPIEFECLSCQATAAYSAPSEAVARDLARGDGWHVVTFVRPDTETGRPRNQYITFCPNCAKRENRSSR